MKKKKEKCDHFWEIIIGKKFSITKQPFRCIKCGKVKKMPIPILDLTKL
jgi:hypothetical protein